MPYVRDAGVPDARAPQFDHLSFNVPDEESLLSLRQRLKGADCEVTDVVEVPGRHAIACAIGGADGHTLFGCTSGTHGQPETSRAERAARIETTTVAVPGPSTA